ncbi:MAG TPA: hypothetical protein VIY69_00995 [Candidatus Acidoferrales bacterium]
MQRSVGVTLSAVLVFFGCAMALLCAVLIAFASQISPSQVLSTPLVRAVLIVEIVIALAFVGWGIASGIGLLQLKQWARMSMIVFSGIMICFCLIPMAIFLFVPLPQVEGMPANFGVMVRILVVLFYCFFVALGAFWIYFFNRKSVKAQFAPATTPDATIVTDQATPGAKAHRSKPVLIIVLGALFLLGACFMPFALKMHTPLFFFGSFVHGAADVIFISAVTVFSVAAGIGLLRLNLWGWRLALFLSIFNVLNTAFLVFTPSAIGRLNDSMVGQYAAMGMPDVAAQYPFATIMRLSFGFSLAVAVAFLWILIAYRKAFESTTSAAI